MLKSEQIILLGRLQSEIEELEKTEKEISSSYFVNLNINAEIESNNYKQEVKEVSFVLNKEMSKKLIAEHKEIKISEYNNLAISLGFKVEDKHLATNKEPLETESIW